MPSMCKKVVIFDLDDTLYKEIDFLKSGYRKVAELVEKHYGIEASGVYNRLLEWYCSGENPFVCLNEKYGLSNRLEDFLNVYRFHRPSLGLSEDTKETLTSLKERGVVLGIITDGREITQKQKIEALGLTEWISMDNVIINEDKSHFKPNHWGFKRMMLQCYEQIPNSDLSFCYVGDNPEKDFLTPNQLGWNSICVLDDGRNIHKQNFLLGNEYLPQNSIGEISEITSIIWM